MENNNFNEDKCFNNTYELITGKRSLDDFLDNEEDLWFLHNPKKETLRYNDPIYDDLIDYFSYTEEYEKCGELVELQKILKQSIFN
tara:strand:+ start:3693 stop:3950 length:258 start_codon:yes stop_codon:yes gene_type:complete